MASESSTYVEIGRSFCDTAWRPVWGVGDDTPVGWRPSEGASRACVSNQAPTPGSAGEMSCSVLSSYALDTYRVLRLYIQSETLSETKSRFSKLPKLGEIGLPIEMEPL